MKILALGREGFGVRIEAYNQIHQLYQTNKVNKTKQAANAAHTEQLQFSNLGKDIGAAQAAISAAHDIREDLVASIKSRMENGTYSVDNGTFAEKLMRKASEIV